jgi:RNA polymerase sigma-70 factor (ECF subfamily)
VSGVQQAATNLGEAADDYLPGSFEDFMRTEYAGVLAFARAITHGWGEAEDLCQEAFLDTYRQWDKVSRYERPGGFVRRVVANRSVSRFRRRAAEAAALKRVAAGRPIDTEGRDPAFWAAVGRLPIRQRQVVALHYLEDRSIADISALLDIAEGTVKAHLHAGRQTLAGMLNTDLEEER